MKLIHNIRDLLYALLMFALEVVLFLKLLVMFDPKGGVLHQSFEFYVLASLVFILSDTCERTIKRGQKEAEEL